MPFACVCVCGCVCRPHEDSRTTSMSRCPSPGLRSVFEELQTLELVRLELVLLEGWDRRTTFVQRCVMKGGGDSRDPLGEEG